MIGYKRNTRGNFQCEFCNHKSHKTVVGIEDHLNDQHLHTYQLAKKDAEIERLKNLAPKTVEKVVYKDKPKPKYWKPSDIGIAGLYCETCKMVMTGTQIPTNQSIENTPHSVCWTRTLKPVLSIQ